MSGASHLHDVGISGRHLHALGGLGILGADIPSGGDDGPAPLFDDLSLPADAAKEYYFDLVSTPSDGAFFMYDDSSFTLLDAPDGVYEITGYVYEDGTQLSPLETVTITVGAGAGIISVPPLKITLTAWPPAILTGTAVESDATESTTPPWVTDFGDSWNSLFPNALNTYTNPLVSYHTAGTSGIVSDIYDAGQALTGDWTVTFDYEDIAGVAVATVEYNAAGGEAAQAVTDATNATPIVLRVVGHAWSDGNEILAAAVGGNTAANGRATIKVLDQDHVALYDAFGYAIAGNGSYTSGGTAARWPWSTSTSPTFRASARYVRARIATTGTVRVNSAGSVRCSVVARTERSLAPVTTQVIGGTLVQLVGEYVAASAVQVNGYGSSFVVATADRILVAPADGLQFNTSHLGGGGNQYTYQRYSTLARTILADDYLEYDVFIAKSPSGTAFLEGCAEVNFTDSTTGRALGCKDANGEPIHAYTRGIVGAWAHRKVSLANAAGKVSSSWDVVCESDVAGDRVAVYDDIKITDGAGTTRAQLWASGEPTANGTDYQTGAFNVQLGPSNSFLAYAFDQTGAQIAVPVTWTFSGV